MPIISKKEKKPTVKLPASKITEIITNKPLEKLESDIIETSISIPQIQTESEIKPTQNEYTFKKIKS